MTTLGRFLAASAALLMKTLEKRKNGEMKTRQK